MSPSRALKAFKYHYRRVPERSFIEFFARELAQSMEKVEAFYEDLAGNQELWNEIKQKLSIYQNGYGMQMTRELPVLYLITRLLKPNIVVETGVASGASSAYIIRALCDNNKGTLHSIDLPQAGLLKGDESGFVVPESLRYRWNLGIGDSKDLLVPLLRDIGEIDLFIHDSLHTYEHMMWEYNTVWDLIRSGGIFLSHDVGANEAFFDFMNSKDIRWQDYRVFHVLGGFKKP